MPVLEDLDFSIEENQVIAIVRFLLLPCD